MSDIVAPTAQSAEGDHPTTEKLKGVAGDAATDVRQEVSSAVADVKDEAVSKVGDVKDEVAGQAHDLLNQTRAQVVQQADGSTQRAADAVSSAGRELLGMADRSEQDGPVTNVVRQLGERAVTMGDRYQQGGYRAVSEDVARFARRSPGTFLLAAVAAGFVVGRIVRNADTKAIVDAAKPGGEATSPEQRSVGAWEASSIEAAT